MSSDKKTHLVYDRICPVSDTISQEPVGVGV